MNTLTTISETNPCFLCCFCKVGVVDDIKFGQLFMFDGVVTHYFCMLFSAALSQNGRDDEGILGFMPHDIMAEVRRSFRLKCTFCNTTGASVGCCNKKCRTAFHFPCGLKNGASYQFFGNYESYCSDHGMHRKITLSRQEWVCPICTSQVHHRVDAIQSSCCGSAVFHKECLQKLALSSGYFFKCPMCNNGKEFVHEMRSMGIFVPEQDASWEREPNAYEDLYYQHSQCDVPDCLCPKGRTYSAQKGNWILARCRICGAFGTHKHCSNLPTVDNWACEPCFVVEIRTEKDKGERQEVVKTEKIKTIKRIAIAGYSGQDEETLQEAYVSARSGNRKVRNGRLHNRVSSKKSQWKFSDLVISPSCFWYFPYDKVRLAQYNAENTLPDWRSLSLNVNLVNWIPKSFFERASDFSDNEDRMVDNKSSKFSRALDGVSDEDRCLISDSEIVVDYVPQVRRTSLKFRRKKSQRKSKWGRGVIQKKKIPKKLRLLESTTVEIKQESEEMGEADAASSGATQAAVKITLRKIMKTATPVSPGSQWVIQNPEQVLCDPDSEEPGDLGMPRRRSSRNIIKSESENMDTANETTMQEIWTDEAFVIDIQSNVEISGHGFEEIDSIPLLQSITPCLEVPGLENEILKANDITCLNEMDGTISSIEESSIALSHVSVLKEPLASYHCHEDNDIERENDMEKVLERLDVNALGSADAKKNEDLLPLTELNTDVGSGLSQSKHSLMMSSQTQKEDIQKDSYQDDAEAKPLHDVHLRTDHPYCKKSPGNITSVNSSVSETQSALLLSKDLGTRTSVT